MSEILDAILKADKKMVEEKKICHNCKIETTTGKPWRTGVWLCKKCDDNWTERNKKLHENTTSVSKSVVEKTRKRKNKNRKKKVITKIHVDGFQARLNTFAS